MEEQDYTTYTENKKCNPLKNDYHSSQYTKENKYVFSQDLKTDREGAILI